MLPFQAFWTLLEGSRELLKTDELRNNRVPIVLLKDHSDSSVEARFSGITVKRGAQLEL